MAEAPDHTDPTGTVDQEAATVESTDEANTVPQDDPTVARPHLITLLYRPDTPAKFTDKFPRAPLRKRTPETFVMGRGKDYATGQNLDVLLNDEHMPRRFVELWCAVDKDGVAKWYVKNLSEKKVVRLELNGAKTAVRFNEVREVKDGHKLKLEMLVLAVRIEEGDVVENAEFDLEFRGQEDSSSSGSSVSLHRQTSSSTDTSGSITSATELARQVYGTSPVLRQNGLPMLTPVNQFGHMVHVGSPFQPLGSVNPPGQFHPQGGVVYPFGGQVQAGGVAMHAAGGAVVYYPAPTVHSLSGAGSHMSAASPHAPAPPPQCGPQDCFQHYPNACCHSGCSAHLNAMPIHQNAACGGHASATPGLHSGVVGSSTLGHPGPGLGSHAPAGPPLYPGAGSHAMANRNPYSGHNAGFFSHPGGNGPPASGRAPPGQSCIPSPGGHGQQSAGQHSSHAGVTVTMPQASAVVPPNGRPYGQTADLPGSSQPLVFYQQSSSSSVQSTRVKELVSSDTPGSVTPQISREQTAFNQFPTLYTQEHHNSRSENVSSQQQQQQQQNQWVLPDQLHGPLSMPQYPGALSSQSPQGLCSYGGDVAQGMVRAPAVITQPESASGGGMPVQQPVVHDILAQQPESARSHNLSGYQPESAQGHHFPGQQLEWRTLHVVNVSGQQPESSAFHDASGQGLGSAALHQQTSNSADFCAGSIRLAGLPPAPAFFPSSELPAAPPVTQLSHLTLSSPVQVTVPFPTEPVSITPANSLTHTGSESATAAAGGAYMVSAYPHVQRVVGDGDRPAQAPTAVVFSPAPHQTPPAMQGHPQHYVNLGELLQAGASSAPLPSLNETASNGNRINLRSHERIATPTPSSSDFSSEGSYRVQNMQRVQQTQQVPQQSPQVPQQAQQVPQQAQQVPQQAPQDSPEYRRQPQEDDERQPQEHDDDQD